MVPFRRLFPSVVVISWFVLLTPTTFPVSVLIMTRIAFLLRTSCWWLRSGACLSSLTSPVHVRGEPEVFQQALGCQNPAQEPHPSGDIHSPGVNGLGDRMFRDA